MVSIDLNNFQTVKTSVDLPVLSHNLVSSSSLGYEQVSGQHVIDAGNQVNDYQAMLSQVGPLHHN